MKILRPLLIFGSILLTVSASCQDRVPGYLGSRFTVMPRAEFLVLDGTLSFGGELGYSISRKTEFYAHYSMYNGRTFSKNLNNHFNSRVFSTQDYSARYISWDERFSAKRFNVGFKFYLNEFVSPVGRYLSISVGQVSAAMEEVSLREIDTSVNDTTITAYTDNVSLTMFQFGFHDRNILSKRFFIDYGITASLLNTGKYDAALFTSRRKSSVNATRRDFIDNTVGRQIGQRMARAHVVTLSLGFGVIF